MPRALAAEIARLAGGTEGRFVLGLTGAPASGKSTLAEALATQLSGAQVLPMDGFHLDDGILNARGHRDRKGAPHTFDVAGFCSILARARVEEHLYAPAFDRNLEISRAGAIEITPQIRILIVEGNYLLYDRGGWDAVRPLLDGCWYLDVPEAELIRRLEARWDSHGLSIEEAKAKIDGNDLPNAQLIARTMVRADRVLSLADLT